jgi:hypothetical protein
VPIWLRCGALRGTQNVRGFASSSCWEEHDCAVASPSAADRLHCRHIDARPRKSRKDIGNGTGTVVAVNVHTCARLAFWVLVRQAGISLKKITRPTQAEPTRTT